MSQQVITIPDIGGATDVVVIEMLVKEGDILAEGDTILVLESDKATMDVPATVAGVVHSIKTKVGDHVSAGMPILTLETKASKSKQTSQASSVRDSDAHQAKEMPSKEMVDIVVPDIGGGEAEVIEVQVKSGDHIVVDQSIVTLESDKATMEMPATAAGTVVTVTVKIGDKVKQGTVVLQLKADRSQEAPPINVPITASQPAKGMADAPTRAADKTDVSTTTHPPVTDIHAGPLVRQLAREFGVDLTKIAGSGLKGRITRTDIQAYVKSALAGASGGGLGLPAAPVVDFAKFGPIETQALARIKRLSGKNLQRNWLLAPHVTQFGEADVSDLEDFRQAQKTMLEKRGVKLTPLVFVIKAVVQTLRAFPQFNASLDATGENLVLKKYFHIGFAVDTSEGLVVPVIRDVEQKGIVDLAIEVAAISDKARKKQLTAQDMQGGCFTISSLGGIGGTAFTPIINLPEVAILGVSKTSYKPVYQQDGTFQARLIMPLSLSYDHRVIDGAQGARFMVYLTELLSDLRKILL